MLAKPGVVALYATDRVPDPPLHVDPGTLRRRPDLALPPSEAQRLG